MTEISNATTRSMRQAWTCTVGSIAGVRVPLGGDGPMREAVRKAFIELTGEPPQGLFSGWGAHFTENELAVMEDRPPTLEGQAAAFAGQISTMCWNIFERNRRAGWWSDITTGKPKERNVGELLMLIVSEVAEGMEGHRKNRMDDKLPHRKMLEVELADAVIRIFDLAGGLSLDLGGALVEKLAYNAQREDHKIENRLKEDGKKY